jgi:uncharacterized protein
VRLLTPVLVGFSRALRAAGVRVGTGDVADFCAAAAVLDPSDLVDLYWAGRTSLVTRRDDIATYDEVFGAYFLGEHNPVEQVLQLQVHEIEVESVLEVPAVEPSSADEDEDEQEATMGLVASGVDTLRHKAFAACTPDELREVRRIMERMRLTPPRRRTRRTRSARHGQAPDLRRTVRDSLRLHGDPVPLRRRRRRVKLRPLVLILDVSGSMADHSRALLQFAWSARRGLTRVEVFCFGTRLTRITVPLQKRSPDDALAEAAELVVDWDGGTRIGASLEEFVRVWGRRGVARGGVVVICSDGMDRGDPDTLVAAMERLTRQCHRIVWCSPHGPGAMGMMVARP